MEPSLWTWDDESRLLVVYDFFCVAGFSILIFCWEFLHLYSSMIPAHNLILWWCLLWFWYHSGGCFIECFWECSLLFRLLEEFEKNQCKFFFVSLVEVTCEAICSWTFVYRELFFKNYRCYFTSSDWPVQIIYFFLV